MTKDGAQALRIVLYPGAKTTRTIVHALATAFGIAIAVRFGFGVGWWAFFAWYLAAFVGVHVLMVPLMTAWHASTRAIETWVRSIIEEELIRVDLQNYEKQLRRVFPGRKDSPDA